MWIFRVNPAGHARQWNGRLAQYYPVSTGLGKRRHRAECPGHGGAGILPAVFFVCSRGADRKRGTEIRIACICPSFSVSQYAGSAAGLPYSNILASILRALLVGLFYGSIIWGVLPNQRGISWEGHLFGLLAGLGIAGLSSRGGGHGNAKGG